MISEIIERVKTKPGYKILALIAVIWGLSHLLEITSPIHKIKTGEQTLICWIGDESKIIDPEKVVDFIPEEGMWVFTNGWAKNCEVVDNNSTSR